MKTMLVLAAVVAFVAAGRAQPAAVSFRAGAAVADITPKTFPVPMSGSLTPRWATQAHDPLHTRALVLDDGAMRIAFGVIDSCAVSLEILEAIKARARELTGIPVDRICLSATHTHTGVSVGIGFQTPSAEEAYIRYMVEQSALAIRQAAERLEPAQVGWGFAEEPRHVGNRRWLLKPGSTYTNPFGSDGDRARMNPRAGDPGLDRPAGPTDPQVWILAARSTAGKPIAVLANYSLHYVGGMPANGLSSDYFGAFASALARRLRTFESNPAFVAMLSNGTSGDINNNDFFNRVQPRYAPYEKIYLVANDVAAAAHRAYEALRWQDGAALRMAERIVDLGTRRPSPDEVRRAQAQLAGAKKLADGSYYLQPDVYAYETVAMADFPATVPVKLQAIRIGDLGVAAIPCEVFVEIGLELRARSPLRNHFTIELANGYNGYLPTAAQHRLGGYETWRARSAYLATDAADRITANLLEMLEGVAR